MPKQTYGHKATIDYTQLNRKNHSKLQMVDQILHEGEVMKCRLNPFNPGLIASVTTSGVVNLYKTSALGSANGDTKTPLVGKLHGLAGETFSLHWNRSHANLLASAVGTNVCIWDVNSQNGSETPALPHGHKN